MSFYDLPRGTADSLALVTGRDTHISRRAMSRRVRKATELGADIEQGRALVEVARVRGLDRVSKEAMKCAGELAMFEGFWMQRVPHAAGRLQHIADGAAIGMADIVTEMGRS